MAERFELFARAHQLFALAMDGAPLLFFFRWHPHQGERGAVAGDEAVQFEAERAGIATVGFDPLIALVELLWTDHVTSARGARALNPQRACCTAAFDLARFL